MATWNEIKEGLKDDFRNLNVEFKEEVVEEDLEKIILPKFGVEIVISNYFIPVYQLTWGEVFDMTKEEFEKKLNSANSLLGGFVVNDLGTLILRHSFFIENKTVSSAKDEIYTFANHQWQNSYSFSNLTKWDEINSYIDNLNLSSENTSDGNKIITSNSGRRYIILPRLDYKLLFEVITVIENVNMNSMIRILNLLANYSFIDGAYRIEDGNLFIRTQIFYPGFSFKHFQYVLEQFDKFLSDIETKAFNCPHCGTENSITNKFCNRCGKEI